MTEWNRPLKVKFPKLISNLEPLVLADLPTPVEKLTGLGKLTGNPELYLKRDDLGSQSYGGNKVRKLEFLLSWAQRKKATTLVTFGGTGSNHLLATAIHSRPLGMRCVGIVFPQQKTEMVKKNQAAYRGLGVKLVVAPTKYLLPFFLAVRSLRIRLKEGKMPLFVPSGGSSPLGSLGFVNAALELAEQVAAGVLPEPQAIFVPYGSGGTSSGLSLGLQLAGLKTRVIAVRVFDRIFANRSALKKSVRAIAGFIKKRGETDDLPERHGDNLEVWHAYFGGRYGRPTPEGRRALEAFRDNDGVDLELTYTAKAAAAFLDAAREMNGPLLFWNTYSSADLSKWMQKE